MSERVLHEWVDDKGRTWHLKNIPHRDATIPWAYRYGPDGSCESSDGGACVDELARLAAENAKLRACVVAADEMRFVPAGEFSRVIAAYDAARAEVDKP